MGIEQKPPRCNRFGFYLLIGAVLLAVLGHGDKASVCAQVSDFILLFKFSASADLQKIQKIRSSVGGIEIHSALVGKEII